jgi:hypothetical protein
MLPATGHEGLEPGSPMADHQRREQEPAPIQGGHQTGDERGSGFRGTEYSSSRLRFDKANL